VLRDLGDAMFCQKERLHLSCRMGRHIIVLKPVCSLGHCECDGHTVNKLSQRRLTADLLAPRERDCSRRRSKVSPDWLPSCIKATRPVLAIFKMAGYFPDSPRTISLTPWGFTAWYVIRYRKKRIRLRFSIIVDQTRSERAETCRAFHSVHL
jgi:hypothetical protein